MKARLIFTLALLSLSVFCFALPKLDIVTEEYPPFNFTQDNQLKGIFVEVMDYVLKDIGSTQTYQDIQVLPWARGYNMALNNENTALFATSFTEERKDLFKWVGPVLSSNHVLIAKKSKNIKINDVKDIKDYKIGVINKDIAEEIVLNKGVDRNLLDSIADPTVNVKKLAMDRVDMIAYGEITAYWLLKTIDEDAASYETVNVLQETPLYIAFSKTTSDEIINAFQKSLEKLKTQDKDKFQEILKKYGN
ncbi:MAG: ABC transporter substrate-binding protein [Candidatus Cloacimonetes bacterium]|nr:ABC transporter substrate-binding protein [Candidatus Cloacimonadota bacterium]MDD4154987.1 ABC transporter substrate-binding protein [Candidatus Cloacimonadota bacterium]